MVFHQMDGKYIINMFLFNFGIILLVCGNYMNILLKKHFGLIITNHGFLRGSN
jgi:hypothetical protein